MSRKQAQGVLVLFLIALPSCNQTRVQTTSDSETHSILVWGDSRWGGICDVPAPNSDFVAIAAGSSHCLGLKEDGSIVAWGTISIGGDEYTLDELGEGTLPLPNNSFIDVTACGDYDLGLRADGSIAIWGKNETSSVFMLPYPNTGFTAIAAGYEH